MREIDRLRSALAKIADIANAASNGHGRPTDDEESSYDFDTNSADDTQGAPAKAKVGCVIKSLPKKLLLKAAKSAVEINPMNQPALQRQAGIERDFELTAARIAVLTTKYWGPGPRDLTVSFLDGPRADLRRRIVGHLNAWNRTAGIRFVETGGVGQVRIARERDGYWSYLGTDITLIPRHEATMNLEGFTMSTPESEYKRVVRHEAGHTLGFPHEHMRRALVARIDPEKAYEYFLETQGWPPEVVDQQVLTPLDERSLMRTPADQTSIMCYQLPGSITRDGRPILGGLDINRTDANFAGRIYPKLGRGLPLDAEAEVEEEELEAEYATP